MKRLLALVLLFFIADVALHAQYQADDYAAADSVINRMSKLLYNQGNDVTSIENSSLFWYKVKTRKGFKFKLVDPEKRTSTFAFNHENLARELEKAIDKKVSMKKLGLREVRFSSNVDSLSFEKSGYKWLYLIAENKLIKQEELPESKERKHWAAARDELGLEPVVSPDGAYKAYVQEYDLYVKDSTGKATQLTFDGSPGEYYSSYIKWSPNSKYVAVNKFRPSEKRFINFMESSPKDQLQPKLKEVEYFKPGDALPIRRPAIFSIEAMKKVDVDFTNYLHQFRISDPEWRADSRAITVEYNERGHQKYSVLEINAESGAVTVLAEENPETFFFYSGKRYRKDINDGEEMIWMSERDGWNHLYLYDGKGNVKNQITKGKWVVREVIHVDEEKRQIIFAASGMNKDEDPYHIHYYTIGFNGKGLKEITSENANHDVTFSEDFNYCIDYFSRADFPGKTVLRDAKSSEILMTLEETDISFLKKENWQMPLVFSAKGRDDKTDIWGVIYRPSNFDSTLNYPIIEYIYAGPHNSFVPKSFTGVRKRFAALAELGFIVVQIDGMGTSNRSKAFHDVCWKNLKDAGFPDRIKWMQAAAVKYPYMDIDRVGIFGGSAGGQSSTGAVLFHPEFYDVAVSSCGCHDNRMDKIWWNELWMGYPVGPHYAECSNVVNAHKLKGNLMLILGEIDDNVDPASTIQVVDALIKANKEFEFVMLPGVKHTIGGDYGERKRRDFFIKHLKGDDLPHWNR